MFFELKKVGVQAIGKTTLLNKLREEGITSSSSNNSSGYSSNNSFNNRQSWSERTSQSNTSLITNNSLFSSSLPLHSSASSSFNVNISTVGIDINEWIYDKSKQKLSSNQNVQQIQLQQQSVYLYQLDYTNTSSKINGPITFRTWDFAGQREYYSTHQVF